MRKYVLLHILSHWNKELSITLTRTNTLFHKLIILMNAEKETKFGITFGQLYAVGSMILAIFAAWVQVNMRITTLEVDQQNTKSEVTEINI